MTFITNLKATLATEDDLNLYSYLAKGNPITVFNDDLEITVQLTGNKNYRNQEEIEVRIIPI